MKTQLLQIGRRKSLLATASLAAALMVSPLAFGSATFDLLSSRQSGAWEANYFRNTSSGRTFCAAETKSAEGALLRVNLYQDNREAFLELFNPEWTFREGGVSFTLSFDDSYRAELRGRSWGDSYTHDFLEQDNMLVLLGLVAKGSQVRLLNSNGIEVDRFSLQGSGQAIAAFTECAGGL